MCVIMSAGTQLGARGQRAQHRILDAALRVFGEEGYRQCGVARIAAAAGCSRASFYQYFSSKEDVFAHLAGQVTRQLVSSAEALPSLTPDRDGWVALQGWVSRHLDIYDRYESVFRTFQAAGETNARVAPGSDEAALHIVGMVASRIDDPPLPGRQLEPALRLLLDCLGRTYEIAGVLSTAAPDDHPRALVEISLTDVVHRSIFGLLPEINAHPPAAPSPRTARFTPAMRDLFAADAPTDLSPAARRTRDALVDAGREVFVRRGYDATRVDDVADAAGVSHGAFYRHFRNKDHLAQVLALRAMQTLSAELNELPGPGGDGEGPSDRASLRTWLRGYSRATATEAALLRVWVDASLRDPTVRPITAASLDWGRRRLAMFLAPRGFGDPDREAVVALALLNSVSGHELVAAELDAATFVVDRGLLGR